MENRTVRWSPASFAIYSESLTADEISGQLELSPNLSRESGDPVSRTPNAPLQPFAAWVLESGVEDSEPMERHVAALLEQLEPKLDRIRELLPAAE